MATTKIIKGSVTQSAVDTATFGEIATGLGVVDQKTLWRLIGLDIEWSNGSSLVAKPNYSVVGVLTRDLAKSSFLDDEVIARGLWSAHGGVGSITPAQAYEFDQVRRDVMLTEVLVANTKIFFGAISQGSGLANTMRYRLYVEEMKVSELEFLKAQTGYCVC